MLPVTKFINMACVTCNMEAKFQINKAFEKLENTSYVCHWHKMEIIKNYCSTWIFNINPIRQDFAYDFRVDGHKCQIENCERDAEIRIVKKAQKIGVTC